MTPNSCINNFSISQVKLNVYIILILNHDQKGPQWPNFKDWAPRPLFGILRLTSTPFYELFFSWSLGLKDWRKQVSIGGSPDTARVVNMAMALMNKIYPICIGGSGVRSASQCFRSDTDCGQEMRCSHLGPRILMGAIPPWTHGGEEGLEPQTQPKGIEKKLTIKRADNKDFLGGSVVKAPQYQCRGHGFNPWSGN